MQALLNEIELDIRELKCLVQAVEVTGNSALRPVAQRSIRQLTARLQMLEHWLDGEKEEEAIAVDGQSPAVEAHSFEPVVPEPELPTSIIADRARPATDLRRSISLNDSFRFARELFGGDAACMNEAISRLSELSSLDEALQLLDALVQADENNMAYQDFVELLKKYYN